MSHRAVVSVLAVTFLFVMNWTASAQRIADQQRRRAASALYEAGLEFMAVEQFEKAAEQFSGAIREDGLLTLAHYRLAQAYTNLEQHASAIRAYQNCIEAFRELYALQQQHRLDVQRRGEEIRELRETVGRVQAQKNRTTELGLSLEISQLDRHLRDLENYETSLKGPFRPPAEVLLALGSAFFHNGDRELAEFEWKAAVDVNPKLAEAHNNLAVVYMQTGRLDEAEIEQRLAERNGFRVHPQFKEDLKKAKAGR